MFTEAKALIHSKTAWIGALQVVIGILAVVVSQYPALQDVGLYAVFSGSIQIILRALTSAPIGGIVSSGSFELEK